MVQKYDLAGQQQWTGDGVHVGEQLEDWNAYAMLPNPNGHLVAVWTQRASSTSKHLYVQRLDPDASRGLGLAGIALGRPDCSQSSPGLVMTKDAVFSVYWIEEVLGDQQFTIRSFLGR